MVEYRAACLDDAESICELIRRAESHDDIPRVLDLAELVEDLESDAVDLDLNSRVAIGDGAIVGVVYILHRPSTVIEQRTHIEGTVDPAWRGRGVGRDLFGWGVHRSQQILGDLDTDLAKFMRTHAYEHQVSALRLAARFGFAPARFYDELLRPLTDLPALARVDDLRIERWPDDRDEEIRVMKNAAFLDHWGSVPTPVEAWNDQVRGFGGRTDLSFIAVDLSDAVVALLFSARYESDDALLGRRDGWIQTLGTLRAWRGRGVGSALLVTALHAYAAAGLTHASLGVDSENPCGAARLYRNLGFEPSQRLIAQQIAVT